MSKRVLKLIESDYKFIREFLIPYIDSYEDIKEMTIEMNTVTKNKIEYYLKVPIFEYLFGVKICINNFRDNDIIILHYKDSENAVKDSENAVKDYIKNDIYLTNSLYGKLVTDNIEHINLFDNNKSVTLPDRYIVNKDATILFYGKNKTIVRRSKGDKVDPVKAFLWAYFLRNTGMSRTKANKYLQKVWKAAQEEIHKK